MMFYYTRCVPISAVHDQTSEAGEGSTYASALQETSGKSENFFSRNVGAKDGFLEFSS